MLRKVTQKMKRAGFSHLKPALAVIAFLGMSSGAFAQTIITKTIGFAEDDMEEIVSSGFIDAGSSDLELINEGQGDQLVGLRFRDLQIPKDAIITNAYIQFTVDEIYNGTTNLVIHAEASDNSAAFTQNNSDISSRTKTTSSVNWSVPVWNTAQERGNDQQTPDLKTVVQDLVSRTGWSSGNAMTFMISGSGKRVVESFEGAASSSGGHAPDQAPTLVVEYVVLTTASFIINNGSDDVEEDLATGAIDVTSSDLEFIQDGSSLQVAAMRFTNINIPKGSTIKSAYIQFTTDETTSDATALTIVAEASDNAAAFTSAAFNISTRSVTSSTVNWNPVAWTTAQEQGPDQRTPDLSSVIQEIVNRNGWKSGNALALGISGTGKRVAESYEGANSTSGGHNANQAPTLVIEFIPAPAPKHPDLGTFPIASNAVWRYLDNGSDQGTAWRSSTFNDSTWAYGAAELGYGDGDEATKLGFGTDANNKYPTTYFRHTFAITADELAKLDSIQLGLLRDDGGIVYINGIEVFRSNMPTGTVDYKTYASGTNSVNEKDFYYQNLHKSVLKTGNNVIAVEIHQDRGNSSDISFSLTLEKVKKTDKQVIAAGTEWKYNDNGNNLGTTWNSETYKDNNWKKGNSVLGYGNGDELTTVSYGKDAANKHITTYFRKNFNIDDTSGYKAIQLNLKRDDGAIVYINGKESFRSNMPMGPANYQTRALTFVEGVEEDNWITSYLSTSNLKAGNNIIAIEIHQDKPTSTDLRFDLALILKADYKGELYSGSYVTCDPISSDKIGCFTSVKPMPQQSLLRLPETHNFQMLMKSRTDVYTSTGELIPNGNDFTGFIPENGSSTKGWLSVNHENTPGGVSMLRIHLDETTGFWVVDSIQKVDFSPLVRTVRNCSGGVTPWGTVITSEETYTSGDANGDGYQDIGWQVEIDPRTGKIVDYDGDGKPDKLWAIGRMSHENIVVAKDSITVYQAEDGGTSCVYKFIADKKGDLSNGKLYVLKRDNATTGTWVLVPNSTQTERNTAREIAAALGGTNWSGPEDIEISPVDGMIYFAAKGPGTVWRFKDEGMTVSGIEAYLSNTDYQIMHNEGITLEKWNTGNDNLDFDSEGNLWILQDGGRDYIWMAHKDHTPQNPHVEIFATSPTGSEPTGITFTPDFNFMFISLQNPSGSNTASHKDVTGKEVSYNASVTMVVARKEFFGANRIVPVVDLGNDITICEGETATLTAERDDAVAVWSNKQTGSTINVKEAGTYSVTMYGNNGKTFTDSVKVNVVSLPKPNLGRDTFICKTCSVILDAGAGYSSYKWSNGATTRTITVNQQGNYSVVVKNANGCEGSDDKYVHQFTTDLGELSAGNFSLKAMPNPFMNESTLRLNLHQPAAINVEVFDLSGKRVSILANGNYKAGEHTLKFNPYGNNGNIFIVKVEIDGKPHSLKLVKQ